MLHMKKNGAITLRNQEVVFLYYYFLIMFLVVNRGLIDIHFKTFVGLKPTKSCSNTCYDNDNPSFNIDYYLEGNYFGCVDIVHWDY